jgi:hypothetical protein
VCRDVLEEVFFLQRQKKAASYTILKIQGEGNAHVYHKVKDVAAKRGSKFSALGACMHFCV